MCGAIVGTPGPSIDDEFSGHPNDQSKQLFDQYLLVSDPSTFPSPVRDDLVVLRHADEEFRVGRLSGDQAKVAGQKGAQDLAAQYATGACEEFRRQP